jgi:hypothetical protein
MRVLTYNVLGRLGDWPARRRALRALLRDLDPDVAVFQETVVLDGYDQVADLLDGDRHILHHGGRTPDGVGMSAASRWPLTPVREELLHVTPRVDASEPWIGSIALAMVAAPAGFGTVLLAHVKPAVRPSCPATRCAARARSGTPFRAASITSWSGTTRGGRRWTSRRARSSVTSRWAASGPATTSA